MLAVGYLLPLFYLLWSLKYGPRAGPNPWGATGLEWQTSSPPPVDNFASIPVVTAPPYQYEPPELDHRPHSPNPLPAGQREPSAREAGEGDAGTSPAT